MTLLVANARLHLLSYKGLYASGLHGFVLGASIIIIEQKSGV